MLAGDRRGKASLTVSDGVDFAVVGDADAVEEAFLLLGFVGEFFFGEEVEDTARSGDTKLDGGADLADFRKRLLEQGDVDEEARDEAKLDGAVDVEEAADDHDGRVGEVGKDAHDRLDDTTEGLGDIQRLAKGAITLLELRVLTLFGAERLDDDLASEAFFDFGVDFT